MVNTYNTYYFLTGYNKELQEVYYIGPFLISSHTSNKYIGQVVSSNSFSMVYTDNLQLSFKLYSIKTNSNDYNTIKYNLIKDSSKTNYVCDFNGILDDNNSMEKELDNGKYKLTFSKREGLIMCPSLHINFF
jgi:hypothetical protein